MDFDVAGISDIVKVVSRVSSTSDVGRTIFTVVVILALILWVILKWASHEGYF